jgi:uncharacterized alpha-E superfamily protein
MLQTCGDEGLLTAEELAGPFRNAESVQLPAFVAAIAAGVFDATTRAGLAFNVRHTTRVAGAVRERLSYDNWRVLAQLGRRLVPHGRHRPDLDAAREAIDDAILSLVAAGGLETAHMTRDDGWRFLSLGRHLERLSFVSGTLIGVTAEAATHEPAVLDWILDLSDSLITYRTRYSRVPDWATVIDLLMFDGRNPRALLFQVERLSKHVDRLPGGSLRNLVRELDAIASVVPAETDDELRDLAARDLDPGPLLTICQALSDRLSEAITHRYFSHVYDAQHTTVNA